MARQLSQGKIYIVCEGEKTEVSFYSDLREKLVSAGFQNVREIDFYKIQEPKSIATPIKNSEIRKEGGRHVNKKEGEILQSDENYEPLNWIKIAADKYPAYTETWAVFDNDHRNNSENKVPFIDNALQKYREFRASGKNVNIAYSSLSFEYYLLQHFCLLYHSFNRTECYKKENNSHKYLWCCSTDVKHPPLEGACDGILENNCCINGYARKQGYWNRSKTEGVLDNIKNIFIGVLNSHIIRWQAIDLQRDKSIGDMNPYLNSYKLTLRIMGYDILERYNTISIPYRGGSLNMSLVGSQLAIENTSSSLYILSDNYTRIFEPNLSGVFDKDPKGSLGRIQIKNNDCQFIDLPPLMNPRQFAILEIEGRNIIVCYPYILEKELSELKIKEHSI